MKTVLITGCSSGYGLESARRFHTEGWNVIATMRDPQKSVLKPAERLRVLPLDVTDADSIAAAVEASGAVDALVNNAGIGGIGAFEAMPLSTAREMFETNILGTMAVTQAFLPLLRKRAPSVIVNVSSSVTLATMPLVAVYRSTKMAVEGFTSTLALELEDLGVRVKLVEPGYCPTTAFTKNSEPRMKNNIPDAYAPFAQRVFGAFTQQSVVTKESDVAEVIYRAANDTSNQLRFPAGPDAMALFNAR